MGKSTKPPVNPDCPSLEDFLAFADEYRFDPALAKACWRFYRQHGWGFGNGDPVTRGHWLTILQAWERNGDAWLQREGRRER